MEAGKRLGLALGLVCCGSLWGCSDEDDGTTGEGGATGGVLDGGGSSTAGEGGDASGGGEPTEGMVPDEGTPTEVNAGLEGSHELEFGLPQDGAPWEAGTLETFVVSADGSLTALGNTISGPYSLNGNPAPVYWNDGTYAWELTNNETGEFKEINVADAATGAWLGQWAEPGSFDEPEMEEGVYEADITISGMGASGAATPPYSQGDVISVRFDVNQGDALTVTDDTYGEQMPTLDSEEENGEGSRLIYTRMDGDVTYTYRLEVDANRMPTRLTIEVADPSVGGYASSQGPWPLQ